MKSVSFPADQYAIGSTVLTAWTFSTVIPAEDEVKTFTTGRLWGIIYFGPLVGHQCHLWGTGLFVVIWNCGCYCGTLIGVRRYSEVKIIFQAFIWNCSTHLYCTGMYWFCSAMLLFLCSLSPCNHL